MLSKAKPDNAAHVDVLVSDRLIANVIIAYDSIPLSKLLERYQAAGNQKAIQLLQKISPVAWRHIHFFGRYMFQDRSQPICLDVLVAGISLI